MLYNNLMLIKNFLTELKQPLKRVRFFLRRISSKYVKLLKRISILLGLIKTIKNALRNLAKNMMKHLKLLYIKIITLLMKIQYTVHILHYIMMKLRMRKTFTTFKEKMERNTKELIYIKLIVLHLSVIFLCLVILIKIITLSNHTINIKDTKTKLKHLHLSKMNKNYMNTNQEIMKRKLLSFMLILKPMLATDHTNLY